VEDGTAIHDTVIKPMALLVHIFQEQAAKTKAYLSVSEAQKLRDTLGDEYDEVIDSILSNWFTTRKVGHPPKIRVRMFFAKLPEVLQFRQPQILMQAGNLAFGPDTDRTVFGAKDFMVHLNPFGSIESYSLDIVLRAHSVGEITDDIYLSGRTFNVGVQSFIQGEVLSILDYGTIKESSEDFIARTKGIINTRELITRRAISTVIPDEFGDISYVYTAGFGDLEQMRDIVQFEGISVHAGNKADLYVNAPVERILLTRTVPEDGRISLEGSGIVQIFSIFNIDHGPIDFSITDSTESMCNSLKDTGVLQVSDIPEGVDILLDVLRAPSLSLVEDLVLSRNRVVCYDPLVKVLFPVMIHGDIHVQLADSVVAMNQSTMVLERITDSLVAYITHSQREGKLQISSLISHIHGTFSTEVVQVITPLVLSYTIMDPATRGNVTNSISPALTLPSGLSRQVTGNTTSFYKDSKLITISRQSQDM
jgi:hypothetical protein